MMRSVSRLACLTSVRAVSAQSSNVVRSRVTTGMNMTHHVKICPSSFLRGFSTVTSDKKKDLDAKKDKEAEEEEEEEDDAIDAKSEMMAVKDEEAAKKGESKASAIPESHEKVVGEAQAHSFQTETQKILHIVAQSLYTEREVFVRELISNASDAMEKIRHMQITGAEIEDKDKDLRINIYTDDMEGVFIIQDMGIGMTKEELIQNLGRIGHSGSLEFLKKLGENPDKASIIGQFGVGFYSGFMVGNRIKVYTRSFVPGSKGYVWESDGSGSYTVAEAEGVERGTKIAITLKENAHEFSNKRTIENVIKKYSNFVGFPIYVNNERINTVRALWTVPKGNVTDQEHKEFYQFIARAYDEPIFKLHYATDSPLNIRGLFYFPSQHMEKYGMGRLEPGVSLFSRKVLIQAKAKGLLPEWLRFVKGVVDSEDIPLNISREHMQDSGLIMKLNSVITKRILKFLEEENKRDPEAYHKWYQEFGGFLKEGVCSDFKWKEDIAKVLRFESSTLEAGKSTNLAEYVSRMQEDQKEIYYLVAPSRALAESSPYFEGFKSKKIEVLFLFTNMDDFVMTNVGEFAGKKLVSAEAARLEAEAPEGATAADDLNEKQVEELCTYMRELLKDRVTIVRETKRLLGTPVLIVDHESASYRRMMRYVDPSRMPELPKQQLEINPKHPVMKKLYAIRPTHPQLATSIAEQLFENALVAAGLMDDARGMLPRLNRILEAALSAPADISPTTTADSDAAKQKA